MVNGLAIASVTLPPAAASPAAGPPLRVLSFNVAGRNHQFERVAELLAASKADVVVLQELSAERTRLVAEKLPQLPYRFVEASRPVYGAVVLSRWPFIEAKAHELTPGGNRAARVKLRVHGIEVSVVGVHLHWPLIPRMAALRDAELVGLARLMSSIEGPRVLVGDFNITRWLGHFATFLASSGLHDCIQDRWPLTTWAAAGWPLDPGLAIRIDQCLHSPDITVADVRTGPDVGSDYPTLNDLRLPAAGPVANPSDERHGTAVPERRGAARRPGS